jgi:hypothetical protein
MNERLISRAKCTLTARILCLIPSSITIMEHSHQNQAQEPKLQFARVESTLCEFCQKFKNWSWETCQEHSLRYIRHQQSFSSLSDSVNMGCKLCRILKAGYMKWAELGYPISFSHVYHESETTPINSDRNTHGSSLEFFMVLTSPNNFGFAGPEETRTKDFLPGFEYRRGRLGSRGLEVQAGPTYQVLDSGMFSTIPNYF